MTASIGFAAAGIAVVEHPPADGKLVNQAAVAAKPSSFRNDRVVRSLDRNLGQLNISV